MVGVAVMVGVKVMVGVAVRVGVGVLVGVGICVAVEVGTYVTVGGTVLAGAVVGVESKACWLLQAGKNKMSRSKMPRKRVIIDLILSDHFLDGYPDPGHGSDRSLAFSAGIQVYQAAHQNPEGG